MRGRGVVLAGVGVGLGVGLRVRLGLRLRVELILGGLRVVRLGRSALGTACGGRKGMAC